MAEPGTEGPSLKKRVWGWYFFDWASQPYSTLLLTFIFSPYFAAVVGDPTRAQELWGIGLAIAGIIIAVLAPVLGAVADTAGRRMPWIAFFSVLYVAGAAALWFAVPGAGQVGPILIAFGIGLIGMEFATIFTNALLPSLGPREETGRFSGSGFAFGYWGGVLSLAIMLLFFVEQDSGRTLIGLAPAFGLDPEMREGTRFVGPLTALWYVVFMVPFFLWVREPRTIAAAQARTSLRAALSDLMRSLRSLLHRPSLAAYLGSSMFYRDALNGLYGFGGIYAVGVLGWSVMQIGIFGVAGAVAAAVCSWLGGRADRRWGPKPVIVACALVLIAVCSLIVGMSRDSLFGLPLAPESRLPDVLFYLCGAVIGGTGGALQAASRTMMVHHTDPMRPTEAFGLYALSGKATAFLAPALIALATAATQSQQWGVSPLIELFVLGLVLLVWVEPDGEMSKWSAVSR
ncbi:MAG: MFS transporter [Gemmobacter sp.]